MRHDIHQVETVRHDSWSPLEWRYARLVDTGFPRGLAARLARDTRYDLHGLIELVERGCPPALADRIMAPLDDEVQAA